MQCASCRYDECLACFLARMAAQGARDKAARAALRPEEARAKGEMLLQATREARDQAPGVTAISFAAAALRLISAGADPD